ncbi:MAG: mevalonate kinase [Desulfurococcaceae archaeon]
MICSKAPGKILLFGEHFVVKGKPALGIAVSRYAVVCIKHGKGEFFSKQIGRIDHESKDMLLFRTIIEKASERYSKKAVEIENVDVYIDSEIPLGAGMGSSAAVSVAFTHALLSYIGVDFSLSDVNEIAFEAEKRVHYRPSGVDNTLSVYGGLLYYQSGVFKRLDLKLPGNVEIVVVDTGLKRATGEVVRSVLERYDRVPVIMSKIYEAGEEIVNKALEYIKDANMIGLGELMLMNHGLLWAIGVSCKECDEIVHEMIRQGAYGGKISGAGKGGVVIGLVDSSISSKILESIRQRGFKAFIVKPDYNGVSEIRGID